MIKKIAFLFLAIGLLISCNNESAVEEEISKIPVEVKIDRFDKVFAEATPEDLPQLKKEYPLLFPKQYPDSVWVNMMYGEILKCTESGAQSRDLDIRFLQVPN